MVSSIAIIFLAIIYCSPAYKCITFTEEEMEIDAEQYDSFYRCQAAGDTIRNASAKNVTLLGVPTRSITNDDVSFLLYTRNNSKVPQILRTSDSIEEIHQSFIDFSKQTILGVHAAWSTYLKDGKFYPKILLPKYDINIIQTNWDSYSFYDIMYLRNMVTPQLGNIVAEFLSHLIAAGANPKKIHLMGYSTGGQVVGLAAKKITPKIARITAFDPQGSCFNFLPSTQRLSESDADYVEIVHCTVGEHAMPLNLTGNVTIYINGGLLQPQCTSFSDAKLASTCSHSMCGVYSHLSLLENDKLLAIKCPSYLHYLQNDCDCSDFVTFGYNISTSVNGLYFLDTSPMAIRKLCPDQKT